MIRVAVVAATAIARAGLESLLRASGRFEVIASAVGLPNPTGADVLLWDLPGGEVLRGEVSSIPTLVLAGELERSDLRRLLHLGVRGIVQRDALPAEIIAAVEAVCEGLVVFSPALLDLLAVASMENGDPDDLPPGEPLTPRESEVLALLAEGAGNREIATRLKISEHTVKFHVSSILAKLGAATRTEAVTRGYREGLIVM